MNRAFQRIAIPITTVSCAYVLTENAAGQFCNAQQELFAANTVVVTEHSDLNTIGDFNGDGLIDLAFSDGSLYFYLNQGDGKLFHQVEVRLPQLDISGIAAHDLDSDGDLDICARIRGTGTIAVLLNIGELAFVETARYPIGSHLRFADLNGDDRTDIASLNGLLLNTGTGTYEIKEFSIGSLLGAPLIGLSLGDFDGDGDIDFIIPSNGDPSTGLFTNDGDANFAFSDLLDGAADTFAGDLDSDGIDDIARGGQVILGDPKGGFGKTFSLATSSQVSGIDDLDGDGDFDLVLRSGRVLLNQGSLAFSLGAGFPGGQGLIAAPTAGALSIGDLNRDGNVDIVLPFLAAFDADNPAGALGRIGIFFGAGNGRFSTQTDYPVGTCPRALVSADLDGDGMPDLATADSCDRTLTPLINVGNGEFSFGLSSTVGPGNSSIFSIASADLNSDTKSDVAAATIFSPFNPSAPWVHETLEEGALGPGLVQENSGAVLLVAFADMNMDGRLDLIGGNTGSLTSGGFIPRNIAIHLGETGLEFGNPTQTTLLGEPAWIVPFDCDGDGDIDIAVASDDLLVLVNNGSGLFQEQRVFALEHIPAPQFPPSYGPRGMDAGDIDGDGDLDLVVAWGAITFQEPGTVTILHNDGLGDFSLGGEYLVGDRPSAVLARDLDGDHDIDLAVAIEKERSIAVLMNDADGTFSQPYLIVVGDGPSSLAAGDYNLDGLLDLAVANQHGDNVSVLLNRQLNVARWFGPGSIFSDGSNWSGGSAPSVNGPSVALFDATSAPDWTDPAIDVQITEHLVLGALAQANGHVAFNCLGNNVDLVGVPAGTTLEAFEIGVPQCGDAGLFPETQPVFRFENTAGSISIVTTPEAIIGVPGKATLELADNIRFEVHGNILNRGVLVLDRQNGSATNSIAVASNAYRQLDGQLLVDLGPDGAIPPMGRLQVGSQAILRGSLSVLAHPGFDPEVGERFTLLTAGEPIGPVRFGAAFLPGLPGGKFFTVEYNTSTTALGSVVLEVQSLGEDLGFGGSDQLSVSGLPVAAELADLNADGLPDIVLAVPDEVNPQGDAGSAIVLLNAGSNGAGVWQGFASSQDIAVGVSPSDVALGDLDGDGFPDAIITNRADGNATVLLNDGTGLLAFERTVGFNEDPAAVVAGDLDEDGLIDVAVAGSDLSGNGELIVRLNLGPNGDGGWGGFTTELDFDIGQGPRFMDIGDLDNDSCLDLLIGSGGDGGVNLLDNLAGGQGPVNWQGFAPPLTITTGNDPFIGDIGDLDNDSCLDIVIADLVDGTLSLIGHAAPPGVFGFTPAATIPVGHAPRSIAVADFDDDLDGDIAIVTDSDDGLGRVVRLLRNDIDVNDPDSQLQFAPTTLLDVVGDPVLVLAGDVDGTGSPDLVAITEAATGDAPAPQGGGGGPTGLVSPRLNLGDALFGCNAADNAAPLGVLDLADVVAFITAFGSAETGGDLNNDGLLDLADLVLFVESYGTGCP